MIADEFIFTGDLCRLKRESRLQWGVKKIYTSPPPHKRFLFRKDDSARESQMMSFTKLTSISNIKMLIGLFNVWICTHILKETTGFV